MSVAEMVFIALLVIYGFLIVVLALLIMNQDKAIIEMEELYENLLDNLAKYVKGEGNEIGNDLGNDDLDNTRMDICGGSDGG